MTRINVIPVQDLSDQHLIAEYREIMRLPGSLKKSLSRRSKPFSKSEIPTKYTLGKGHVKFFYNKFGYLKNRFYNLLQEMHYRGFRTNFNDASIFDVDKEFMGNYEPTPEAIYMNIFRIKENNEKSKEKALQNKKTRL